MKHIKNLFFSLSEILIIMLIQYIIAFIIFCTNKDIILGSILISVVEIIYIIIKIDKIKLKKDNYFPYFVFGISICIIYNMLIFLIGYKNITININIILNIILTGIIGPIFEELLFRYSFINKLKKYNYNNYFMIITSSIVFSLCHSNHINMIYSFIIGIINSYFYIKKDNILIPIIIHMSINILSIFLLDFNIFILILGIILNLIFLIIFRVKKA